MSSKEIRQENFRILRKAVDDRSICNVIQPSEDWGGAHVIITSDEEKVFLKKIDKDDFYSRRSGDLYVVTKESAILSGLFRYVKENVLSGPDNYLYAFMALSANDFIKQNGDDDCLGLLSHVIDNAFEYMEHFGWENSMGDSDCAFEVMRKLLSDATGDDDIRFML